MQKKYNWVLRLQRNLALFLLFACLATGCSNNDTPSIDKTKNEVPESDYNALITALPPLLPKGELESSAEFAKRAKQRVAHLSGKHLRISVPAKLGNCKIPENSEISSVSEYVGLRYNADSEQLEVCALDNTTIPHSVAGRSYGLLITNAKQSTEKLIGKNLMGAEVEITQRINMGIGIFADIPSDNVREFSHGRVPLSLPLAKDLLSNGARLVYEVILDPEGTGNFMTNRVKKSATMLDRESFLEEITGLEAKVLSVSLESSTNVLIAQFEFATESHAQPGLALVPNPDSLAGKIEGTPTRYGILRMGEGGTYLDQEKVFGRGLAGPMRVVDKNELGQHDVVFTEEDSGGSAGYSDIVLIDIAPDRKVLVFRVDAPGIRGFSDPKSDIHKAGNNLILNLGFKEGKRRQAIFNGTSITTVLEAGSPTPIPDHLCKLVHAVVEACAERYSPVNNCSNTLNSLSNAERGGIEEAFEYPAKIEERFNQICDAACTTGNAPKYVKTKSELCATTP